MWPIAIDGVAWSVCLSFCHVREPCRSSWTDCDAIQDVNLSRSPHVKEQCWGQKEAGSGQGAALICWLGWCTLALPGEYDWTVCVWLVLPFVQLLWTLVIIVIRPCYRSGFKDGQRNFCLSDKISSSTFAAMLNRLPSKNNVIHVIDVYW